MAKSNFICMRCEVSVIRWMDGWKHATGGNGYRSCGKAPLIVSRAEYDRDITAMVDAVRKLNK